MAEHGIIPRKLAKVPPPKCPSCLCGINSSKWLSTASSQENLQRSLLLNVQAVFVGRLTESRGECTKLTQKSNRQPYQELWSALTNLNPLFRALYPLQKGNLRSEGIEVRRCSWTTRATSHTSTCTNTSQRTKQSTRNTRSRSRRATRGTNPPLPL